MIGLINDIFIFSLTNAVATPIFCFLDMPRWFKLLKRCLLRYKGKKNTITNMEATTLLMESPMQLAFKYGSVIKTVWFCGFYSSLLPVIYPIGVVSLILYFWI